MTPIAFIARRCRRIPPLPKLLLATMLPCAGIGCVSKPSTPSANIADADSVPFMTLYKSLSGTLDTRHRMVIRDDSTFRAIWRQSVPVTTSSTSPPLVDFRSHMVILASRGALPDESEGIDIAAVRQNGDSLVVVVRTRRVGARCLVGSAESAPLTIVRIPRSVAGLRFEELSEIRDDCRVS
jgi:hypothetical protein